MAVVVSSGVIGARLWEGASVEDREGPDVRSVQSAGADVNSNASGTMGLEGASLVIGSCNNLVRGLSIEGGGKEIVVDNYAISPIDSSQADWVEKFGLSFTATEISAWTANDILVVGTYKDRWVMERWILADVKGAFEAIPLPTPSPIGTPMSVSIPTMAVFGGGGYTPVASRDPRGATVKDRFYDGDSISSIDSVVVDPQGRFVVVLDETEGKVWQVKVSETPQVVLLLDSSAAPILQGGCGLSRRTTLTGKVVYEVWDTDEFTVVELLWDNDNDGVIDLHETYGQDVVHTAYPETDFTSVWW